MTFGPLEKPGRARKYLTYDLEWIPGTLELRMVGVYDGARYRWYESIADFLNGELTKKNRGAWFYAHAGGLADLQFVFEYLIEHQAPWWKLKAAFSGSSAIIVTLQHGKHSWHFVDSFWLLRQSLRKIGGWMGMAKGGAEDSHDIFHAPLPELVEYNEQDCRILWHAIERFEEVLQQLGGQLEKTVASSALGLFRRRYMTRKIETHESTNDIAREAYVASRVEVFSKRCERAEYWDINSSFPAAMLEPQPCNVVGTSKRPPKPSEGLIYIADAEVEVPDDAPLPPLPFRTGDRRLYFPTGRWRGWFGERDLQNLEEGGGRIVKLHECANFDTFDDLAAYATEIYDLRKASSDEGYKTILKILLNSLYGKFAEQGIRQALYINPGDTRCPHVGPDGKPLHPDDGAPGSCWEMLLPGVWLHVTERNIPHASVPISMHITSIARARLDDFMRRSINRVGETGEVYYCDTDGFATTPDAPFTSSKELGDLKQELIISSGEFAAPKLYAMQVEKDLGDPAKEPYAKVKAKGFGGGVSYERFCELLEKREDDDWSGVPIDHFVRIKEGLRKGWVGPREEGRHKKFRGLQRQKRMFFEDGSSRPWRIDELKGSER